MQAACPQPEPCGSRPVVARPGQEAESDTGPLICIRTSHMRRPDAKTAETTMEQAVICNPVSHMRREIAKASWVATKGWGREVVLLR
jgi:hypothetical protein